MKKILVFLIISVMILNFCSCSQNQNNSADDNEVTIFLYDMNCAFKDDYPIYVEAEKKTGIHIKGTIPQSVTDRTSAFNLMMATGNVADIVHASNRETFAKYGSEGIFIPLNDLIEKYAPNFKKILDEKPYVREYITFEDGNIYYIPNIPDGKVAEGWFIRKDWLERLELETPKNIDELYEVMKAIKNGDPNGNGKNDEIPYFCRNAPQSVNKLFALWGMNGDIYAENGIVKMSAMEPQFKEAVSTVAKWYSEGLIDPEIYTRGPDSRSYMLENNIGGITHDWFSSTGIYNKKLKEEIPGFDFGAFAPPAGYDGKIREFTFRPEVGNSGYAISSSNKDPVMTIKWIDFWFSEEGKMLMNYGIEGEDYLLKDGKPVFTQKVLDSELAVAQYLQSRGGQGDVPFEQDFEYEKQWMTSETLKSIDEYINNGYLTEHYVQPLLSEDDLEVYDSLMPEIHDYVDEQVKSWILGTENIDETYEKFISGLKELGAEKVLEILNNNY